MLIDDQLHFKRSSISLREMLVFDKTTDINIL